MAYYLGFDPASSYVETPAGTAIANTDDYELEIFANLPSTSQRIINSGWGTAKWEILNRNTAFTFGCGGVSVNDFTSIGSYLDSWHTWRFKFGGGNIEVFVDDVLVVTTTMSSTALGAAHGSINFARFNSYQHIVGGGSAGMQISSAKIKSNGTVQQSYNPTLSAEAGGTLLIDEVSGEHGTLNGFSADPFVYYYGFLNPADEDTTNDNCLVFDGGYVTFNDTIASSSSQWELEYKTAINYNGSAHRFYPVARMGNRSFYIKMSRGAGAQNNEILFRCNAVNYTFSIPNFPIEDWHTYLFKCDGVDLHLYIDDALQETKSGATPVFTSNDTINSFGSSNGVIEEGLFRLAFVRISLDTDNRFYDFNRSPATAPVVPELINGQNGTIVGGATYEPIIDTVTFTTGDYATLPLFVTAESANSDYREYLAGTTAGATISGFSDGVIINGGTVTSPITLTQTGIAEIKNATCDDIDATGASGDVTIIDCEVKDVTG